MATSSRAAYQRAYRALNTEKLTRGSLMGVHKSESAFQPSDPSQFTSNAKREPEMRFPAIGAHAGAWEEARPGCTVKRVMQLEHDVSEAQRLNEKARGIVRKRVSASGVLRKCRVIV